MSDLHSYPSIYQLGHKAVESILDGDVVIQEKYDGSQFSFGLSNGELYFRSKRADLYPGNNQQFEPAVQHIMAKAHLLQEPCVYRGEAITKQKHNTINYGRVPDGYVVLFDVELPGQDFLSPENVADWANTLGIEPAVTFHRGSVTVSEAKALIEGPSSLGGDREGIVIKNYSLFTAEKKIALAKLVREDFKETNSANWRAGKDILSQITEKYRNEARWNKTIQHLRDEGRLQGAPQDIGLLMRELNEDILRECGEDIKDLLFRHYWKDISRGIGRGFPEWYKGQLLVALEE